MASEEMSMKQGELDFVIAQNGKVIPIEVKAGKDYERHNALTNVLANDDYNIDFAYVLICRYTCLSSYRNPLPQQIRYSRNKPSICGDCI